MDDEALKALVASLQLVMERPRVAQVRGRVGGIADGESIEATVSADRRSGEWSVEHKSGAQQSGAGPILPYEAALVMPAQLPVWGRSEDAYVPIMAEKVPGGFRIVARHREFTDAVCGLTLRSVDQVAASFFAPDYSLTLVELSGR